MSVTATPSSPSVLLQDDVRAFMRDFAGMVPNTGRENILMDNVEFSDADLQRAIRFTVARYNAMTPITFTGENSINAYVLMVGVASWLLKSEAMRQLRNQATTQDGDVQPIGVDDKAQLYMQFSQMLGDEFEKYARGIKTQKNMEAAYGGLGSGYSTISRNHHA